MPIRTRTQRSTNSKPSSIPVQTGFFQRSSIFQSRYDNTSLNDSDRLPLLEQSEFADISSHPPHFGHNFSQIKVSPGRTPTIQTKLAIGKPNDKYEQEADRVADQVMRMPEPKIQRLCPKCNNELQRQPMEDEEEEEKTLQTKPLIEQITPLVQRQIKPMEEEEEEKLLQTKTTSAQPPTISSNLQNQITALRGGGQPLPQSERAFFEPRFGTNFSHVRVHTDERASQTAGLLNAQAFTVGSHIVFGANQHVSKTTSSRTLLAHELTHVVQQNSNPTRASMAQRSLVKHHLKTPQIQGKWQITRADSDEVRGVPFTSGNGSAFSLGVLGNPSAVFGQANTWQSASFWRQSVGGQAQVDHLITKHYTFRNDGTSSDSLQIKLSSGLNGNAKAEDKHYARAGAVVWGTIAEKTTTNPAPAYQNIFPPLQEGGISEAETSSLGTIDADIPVGDRSAHITIPLTRVSEGRQAVFNDSTQTLRDVPNTINEVDVLLGARIEADSDIETVTIGFPEPEATPLLWPDKNTSRALAHFSLNWENRPAPGSGSRPSEAQGFGEDTRVQTPPVGDWDGKYHHYRRERPTGTFRIGSHWTDYNTNCAAEARRATGVPDPLFYRATFNGNPNDYLDLSRCQDRSFNSLVFNGTRIVVKDCQSKKEIPQQMYSVTPLAITYNNDRCS